jgi:hypothetical protein
MRNIAMICVILLALTLSAQGLDLQGAQELVNKDPAGNVMDWSINLAMHDYRVPMPGELVIGNETYRIENNGTIVRCEV